MIIFDEVSKEFPTGQLVLSKVSFHIKPQEIVVFEGRTGSGKTTIFRLIYKELEPTTGKVVVDGQELNTVKAGKLAAYRRKIGYAFQDFKLIGERTVAENIALILEIMNYKDELVKERVRHLLELVDLKDKGNLFPRQLSGGEIQRVSIARAVAHEPKILLADEPTGNLDEETTKKIAQILEQINKLGTTVVVASHDQGLIKHMRARRLKLKEGRILSKENDEKPKDES